MGSPFGYGQTYVPSFVQNGGGGMPQGGGMGGGMFGGGMPSNRQQMDPSSQNTGIPGSLPNPQGPSNFQNGLNNTPGSFPGMNPSMDYSTFQINPSYLQNRNISNSPVMNGNSSNFAPGLGQPGVNSFGYMGFNDPMPQFNGPQNNSFSNMQGQWGDYMNNLYAFQNQYGNQFQNMPNYGGYKGYSDSSDQAQGYGNPNDLINQAKTAYSDMYNRYAKFGTFGIPN